VYSSDQQEEFYSKLPRKRSAVGVVIFKDDKLLLLKPTYKNDWLVPGGIIESSESPLEAAQRECVEEIGCEVKISRLVCVDYKRGDMMRGDTFHALFLGQIEENQEFKINADEIIGYDWAPTQIALGWMESHLSNRVKCALEALRLNNTLYCEEGIVKF
jgi:8-oxo-dGTP pyrophosphatase MutT (NUDIX family)